MPYDFKFYVTQKRERIKKVRDKKYFYGGVMHFYFKRPSLHKEGIENKRNGGIKKTTMLNFYISQKG